jgi:hypothetical protein
VRRPPGRKRRIRWYVGAVVVLYVLVVTFAPSDSSLPADAGAAVASGRDANLGRVASAIVGSKAKVWCWSQADWREKTAELTREYHARGHAGRSPYGPWSAFATPDRGQIHLSPEVCAALRRLADERAPVSDSEWRDAQAWAVAALAHEAYHVVGVTDEAVAECYGMQSIARTVRLLGRSDAEGRELTRRYLKRWRPGLPPSYRSNECRGDGVLDLEPDRASWP